MLMVTFEKEYNSFPSGSLFGGPESSSRRFSVKNRYSELITSHFEPEGAEKANPGMTKRLDNLTASKYFELNQLERIPPPRAETALELRLESHEFLLVGRTLIIRSRISILLYNEKFSLVYEEIVFSVVEI